MAEARMRTLIGRGVPVSSRSAVWSVMSRSTLMTLLEIVVAVVSSGNSFDLPGPRYVTVPPCSQLTIRIVPASTLRRKLATMTGTTITAKNTTPPMIITICDILTKLLFQHTYSVAKAPTRCSDFWQSPRFRRELSDRPLRLHQADDRQAAVLRAVARSARSIQPKQCLHHFHRSALPPSLHPSMCFRVSTQASTRN